MVLIIAVINKIIDTLWDQIIIAVLIRNYSITIRLIKSILTARYLISVLINKATLIEQTMVVDNKIFILFLIITKICKICFLFLSTTDIGP